MFSTFQRGMIDIYQHCGEAHLHRYLAEFNTAYNRRIVIAVYDVVRAGQILEGILGKRFTYETARE
ncbi:MAG: hypothetical protein JJ902_15470 [Roseibium sp.]|nr:hypothetical protein [Roseibium sp.]